MEKLSRRRTSAQTNSTMVLKSRLFMIVFLAVLALSLADEDCKIWRGQYRDCTCGLYYRDVVTQCSNEDTIGQPVLTSETIANESCPFQCLNGGELYRQGGATGCRCKDGFSGLCCETESRYCGGTFFEPSGEFTTPLFPHSYPNNFRCVWKISTDPTRRIALGVKDNEFEVEPGTSIYSCNHDWVSVYDGEDKNARRIGSYCGNGMRTLQTIQSSGRHLYIEFRSNWQQRRKGFKLQYQTFPMDEECGMRFFSHPVGIIVSPQYPLKYGPNMECNYIIKVKPNHDVVLTVREIQVTATADCSTGDSIIIGKRVGKKLSYLTVFCGEDENLIPPYTVRGADFVVLKFNSDYRRDGRFKILYQQIPLYK